MTSFVDTNVFVRFLAGDDPAKAARSGALLAQAAQGKIELMTSEAVILEVVQVLESRRLYALERPLLAKLMQSLIENPGLRIDHKTALVAAFDCYAATRLDYTDCLAIEHARRVGDVAVYSDDRGLDRVSGVRRLEP